MARNFITNDKHQSLKSRIQNLIRHSQELKFLVGFFYFSGWKELYEALRHRDDLQIKILVGLDTDVWGEEVVEVAAPQARTMSQQELIGRFYVSLRHALRDETLDTQEFHEQVSFFLRLLEEGRLQIRRTHEPNHAKLYLFKLREDGQLLVNAPGRFITGSSNLTRAGLVGQQEFNVEMGDYGWEDAEGYFDELWEQGFRLSEVPEHKEQILNIIRRQTQVAEITPYEAYALVLKTYIDLMEQRELKPRVKAQMGKRGYRVYRYQEDAVQQALTVLENYGGVILADVVGLGKSIIASWLAAEVNGRGLVICPPALVGDPKERSTGWYKYLSDFGLHDWNVYSLGKLEEAQKYLAEYGDDVTTIIVDEAHRFRNEDTEAYERLSQICVNRKVVLLTATPFNNAPADIAALLKLFVPPGKSSLTLDEKLAARFARFNSEFRRLSYILRYADVTGEKQKQAKRYYHELFGGSDEINKEHVQQRARTLAKAIRAVIEPVVIRRNRLDLKRDPDYQTEVTELSEVEDPKELFFELTREQSLFYDQVIREYFSENGQFRGAIYQPYAYERKRRKRKTLEEDFTYQQQRNLYEFMRRLLVKRFESSFGAFAQSIRNFISIHEKVLAFIENSGGRYILDRRLLENTYELDSAEIDKALSDFAERLAEKGDKLDPRHDRIYVLDEFDDKTGFLRDIRSDLSLLRSIGERVEELRLVENDPKAAKLLEAVGDILRQRGEEGEPRRKVVIFSEYRDTVDHIAPLLREKFPRLLVAEENLSKKFFDELLTNFDASVRKTHQRDDYDILLATDKLAEGVNLNRAGAVINYDIPWNPTRVIQRLGRINRIGQKVFKRLYIYNFFPTEQGADIIKSREIAAHKMFLIHNTLGEDAKIFAPDETPTAAALFQRINTNPEKMEEESLLTKVRLAFAAIKREHPEVCKQLGEFSPRVKTAKPYDRDELLVFRRKGLQLFTHIVANTAAEKPEPKALPLDEALPHIACTFETPRLGLSQHFWKAYEEVRGYRDQAAKPMPQSEQSLLNRATNNLRSAMEKHADELHEYLPFIQTLLRDLKEFQTLPKYTLRRLTSEEMDEKADPERIGRFKKELDQLRRHLGDDYLARIEKRAREFRSEIIIAVENRRRV